MRTLLFLLVAAVASAGTPQRIISTAPSITEALFAIGAGPRVVAVTVYCKYPPEVHKLPKIGTYLTADVEAISALHPDLVVVEKQPNNLVQQLKLLRIPEIEVRSGNLEEVYQGAMAMGKAAGVEEGAIAFVTSTKAALIDIQARTSSLPHPTAVFIIGHTPGSLRGLIAGAKGSYFSDLLTIAGAKDVFADSVAPYPQITLEEILSRNPDLIFEMSGEAEPAQADVRALWQAHPSLRAVKNKHVYALPSGPFLVPGPRVLEAVRVLLQLVHPEVQP